MNRGQDYVRKKKVGLKEEKNEGTWKTYGSSFARGKYKKGVVCGRGNKETQ